MHLALLQDFGLNMRPQIPRLRIYSLIFLFNPDGESRLHCSNGKSYDSEQYKNIVIPSEGTEQDVCPQRPEVRGAEAQVELV